jgi:uncharacterized membrane protein YccC
LGPFSLLFGALFVGVGVSFLFGSTIGDAKGSVWPLFAIILGSSLVGWAIAAVLRERRPIAATANPESSEGATTRMD